MLQRTVTHCSDNERFRLCVGADEAGVMKLDPPQKRADDVTLRSLQRLVEPHDIAALQNSVNDLIGDDMESLLALMSDIITCQLSGRSGAGRSSASQLDRQEFDTAGMPTRTEYWVQRRDRRHQQ